MVINSLFKIQAAGDSFFDGYTDTTRIVWFWLHQQDRLTDGHIAIPENGTPRVCVNWTTQGRPTNIAERAAFDEKAWRETVGLSELQDDALRDVVLQLQIEPGERAPQEAFADAIDYAIRETESDLNWQFQSDAEAAFKAQKVAL